MSASAGHRSMPVRVRERGVPRAHGSRRVHHARVDHGAAEDDAADEAELEGMRAAFTDAGIGVAVIRLPEFAERVFG
jgi:hypothetical protein